MPLLRCLLYCFGVGWISKKRATDFKLYKKYLGEDWKPTWTGHGLWVCNHLGLFDILVAMLCFDSAFVAKTEVKNWYAVGKYA